MITGIFCWEDSSWPSIVSQAKRVKRLWHFCHVWNGTSMGHNSRLLHLRTHREKHISLTCCAHTLHRGPSHYISHTLNNLYTPFTETRTHSNTRKGVHPLPRALIHANPRCDSRTHVAALTHIWSCSRVVDSLVLMKWWHANATCVNALCPLQADKRDPQGATVSGFEVLLQKQLKGKQMQKEMAEFIRERWASSYWHHTYITPHSLVPLWVLCFILHAENIQFLH